MALEMNRQYRAMTLLAALLAAADSARAAPAATVAVYDGKAVVTEADIRDAQLAQRCYGEGAQSSRKAVFMRRLEAAIAEDAMLRAKEPPIDAAALRREVERIDSETRAPEIIACVKAALGGDAARYAAAYARPVLVEARFRIFLSTSAAVQGEVRRRAAAAFARASEGLALAEAAKRHGLEYSSGTYASRASSEAVSAAGSAEDDFIRRELTGLEPGKLVLKESDYDLSLLRVIAVNGPSATFEKAVVRKASQEYWFKSLKKRRLEVLDGELFRWLSGIGGNPRLYAVSLTGKP